MFNVCFGSQDPVLNRLANQLPSSVICSSSLGPAPRSRNLMPDACLLKASWITSCRGCSCTNIGDTVCWSHITKGLLKQKGLCHKEAVLIKSHKSHTSATVLHYGGSSIEQQLQFYKSQHKTNCSCTEKYQNTNS